ncbi:MAG TPA: prenyltransferase/squalene oxidase repeat-containing protein, partial [Nitrospira sp.]
MKLIRTILDRLSDRLFISVPQKMRLAADVSSQPPLRLVSDKSAALPTADSSTRRSASQMGSQLDAIDDAVRRSQAWFLARQHPTEGYWVAELEADTTLTSEYLMLRRFLDRVDPERERKAVRYLRATQLPDGGWPIYYGGPSEISASVKAYFALKLSGISADEPFMLRARDCIRAHG